MERFRPAGGAAAAQPGAGALDATATLVGSDGGADRPQQGGRGTGEQAGTDLLGGVVSRAALQRRLAEQQARLTAGRSNQEQVFSWLW